MHLVEFEAYPCSASLDGAGRWRYEWQGKVTVDFQWVAGVKPGILGMQTAAILLAGSPQWIDVNVPYSVCAAYLRDSRQQPG